MRKHTINIFAIILGLGLGLGIFGWSFWQADILISPYLHNDWFHPFDFYYWVHGTVGMAYDVTKMLMFVGILIAIIVPFVALWFWED